MQHRIDGKGLLLTARYRSPESENLVVTVGLLIDCDSGSVFATDDSWEWITQRFAGMAFDRGLKKQMGTFAVHGQAFALNDAQTAGMEVRVQVGNRHKRLHVFPSRTWRKHLLGWRAVPQASLDRLSLTFENTYGGDAYAENPIGQGYQADARAFEGSVVAPIESADCPVLHPADQPLPATFLPLPPNSCTRLAFMGTLDEQWATKRAPWPPLDVDPRWFNEVAQDQCHERFWRGDEAWSVTGMHPHRPHFAGRLPAHRPRLFVEFRSQPDAIEEVPLDLDTVWLFPDAERFLLLYRVQIPVGDPDATDIAALGLACERAEDPVLNGHAWVRHLWPLPEATEAQADAVATPESDEAAVCEVVQAAADRVHAEVASGFEQSMQALTALSKKMGVAFDPAAFNAPARPDIAASLAQARVASDKPFDGEAHEAKIRAVIAQARTQTSEQVACLLGAVSLENHLQQIQAMAADGVPLAAMDVDKVAQRLPADNASLRTELAAGLARINELELEISGKIAAVREELAANAPAAPTAPHVDEEPPADWTRERVEAAYGTGSPLTGQRFVGLDLSAMDLAGADFRASQFEGCRLQACTLDAADLRECVFVDCTMDEVRLQQARLDNAVVQRCSLEGGVFDGASLENGYAEDSSFTRARMAGVQLADAQFSGCMLHFAIFTSAQMQGMRLQNCVLEAACLVEANLAGSQWQRCTVHTMNIAGANLQSALWSEIEGQGINARGAHLNDLRVDQASQLPDACFDQANLSTASLDGANLKGASLRGACLERALFNACDLSASDGYRLTARGADFTGSDLSGACWRGANLMEASLRRVTLDRVDFSGCNLHAAFTEAVRGTHVRLEQALLTRCRILEDLVSD